MNALLLAGLLAAPAAAQTAAVSVAYPLEGHVLPPVAGTFVLGVTTPAAGTLLLNGATVQQHANGAFLAFVPVQPGTFTFRFDYTAGSSSATFERTVKVTEPPRVFGPDDALAVDHASLTPGEAVGLQPGDWTPVSVRGTPGVRAHYRIKGHTGWTPMLENPAVPGLYEAAFVAPHGEALDQAEVRIKLKRGWRSKKVSAPGRITSPAPFTVVETSTEPVPLRGGANRGYVMFPQLGTRFLSDGRLGGQIRLRLSPGEYAWAGAAGLRALPAGTLPPEAVLDTMRTEAAGREARVLLSLSAKVPYRVDLADGRLSLRLYQTVGHTNTAVYGPGETMVRELRWRQEAPLVAVVDVLLNPGEKVWGWRVSQDAGRLVLTLRRPPALAGSGAAPWKGLTVVLDPGHSAGRVEGAVGPTGRREAEANLGVTMQLKPLLEAKGASVVVTRDASQEVPLEERPRLAWGSRGDLLVSIHHNALPDGVDPFASPRGFMVFYYHPQSLDLAAALHGAFKKLSPVPDEGLRYGNLLVAREPGMPAVLTEADYMMFPDREERLFTEEYQRLLARIHLEGIEAFLKGSGALAPAKAGPAAPSAPKKP